MKNISGWILQCSSSQCDADAALFYPFCLAFIIKTKPQINTLETFRPRSPRSISHDKYLFLQWNGFQFLCHLAVFFNYLHDKPQREVNRNANWQMHILH